MRDLANQNIIRRKSAFLGRIKIILIVLIVIIVGIFVLSLFLNSPTSSGESANLHDAPKGLTPVKVNGQSMNTSGAVNLSKNTISLSSVNGSGSGTATRTFGDGGYSLSVSATLPNPKGDRYEVWLTNGSDVKEAGIMDGSGTSWSIVFNDKDTYSKYNEVWVTRQVTTTIGKPETKVLVGGF